MKKINLLFLLCLMIGIAACSGKANKESSPADSVAPVEPATVAAAHKYGIKSGIITYTQESSLQDKKNKKVVYFDDFGAKETSELFIDEVLNDKVMNNGDGFFYQISIKNGGKKTANTSASGTEMKFDASNTAWPDQVQKDYGFKKLPNETICGKDCEVFSTDNNGTQGKFAGWNGILMMLETKSKFGNSVMTTRTTASEIKENVEIPASVWEIPAGVKMFE
jgi:hypothetical protein